MKLGSHSITQLWTHGLIIWNCDDLSSISSVDTPLFIFQELWPWHYFRFAPLLPPVWTNWHLVPHCKWRQIPGWLVGITVCVRRLVSDFAGDTPISWKGVLRYFSNPSNGSLWSAAALFRIPFVVCTALSAAPFDCGYCSELVVWQDPHSLANSLNSRVLLNRFLVLLYCNLLSLTASLGIPNRANIFLRLL